MKKYLPILIEKFSPAIIALISSFLWSHFNHLKCRVDISEELANPIVSVMAIGAGFIGASLSILLTATSGTIRKFKSTDGYPRLIDYHYSAIISACLSCASSLIIIANKSMSPKLPYTDWAWFFFTILATGTFFRVLIVLKLLFPKKNQ